METYQKRVREWVEVCFSKVIADHTTERNHRFCDDSCKSRQPIGMEWETIDTSHERAKVFGGWLVKVHEPVYHLTETQNGDGWDWRVAMTFVPDPNYEWELPSTGSGSEEETHG